MPNYANGKIYQIISPNHPMPYIGSTTQALCRRMAEHRRKNNICSSRILIESGDAYIQLIAEYPCENKEQLNRREGEMIRERECVNRCVAGRTLQEYHQDNKEAIAAQQKAYRETYKEAISARKKAQYNANKEAEIARSKAYYEANKEAITARRRANRKKAKEPVDVLQEQQGQENQHSQSNEAPQSE